MKRSDIDDDHVLALARATFVDCGPGVVVGLVAEGIPRKLARAKAQHLVARGLMRYGVSIDCAWPEPFPQHKPPPWLSRS